MNKEYSLKSVIVIYTAIIICLVGSIFICINGYVETQSISLSETPTKELIDFVKADKVNIQDRQLYMNFDQYEISQLILGAIDDPNIDVESLVIDLESDKSYISLRDKKDKVHTLSFKANYIQKGDGGILELGNFQLGSLNSKLLGRFYGSKLSIPNEIELKFPYENDLVYISNIKPDEEGNYKVELKVQEDKLLARLDLYMENKDDIKIRINKDNYNYPDELIDVFSKEKASLEDVRSLINVLSNNKDGLQNVGLLLNEEGINNIHDDLSKLYSKESNAKRILEKSEYQVESNLKKFHKDFSTMVLSYLYSNPNYIIQNGMIYINGNPINADTILNHNNYKKEHDVKLTASDVAIESEYDVGSKIITKTILNRGE